MRVLLDEMVDGRLGYLLPDEHEVLTVARRGWRGLKNGELLRSAEKEFDALLTTDRNIPYQQNLSHFDLAVVILRARTNTYEDLVPVMNDASDALMSALPGRATFVQA